jgi:hypothetical protein
VLKVFSNGKKNDGDRGEKVKDKGSLRFAIGKNCFH